MKVTVLALLMAVLPALVFAYPGFGGGRGLFRVQNALVEQDAGLTVSLHALARNAEFGPDTSGWIGDLVAPELSYAPIATRYVGLELFGSWGGRFQYPASPIGEEFVWGLHDLKAGGKLSIPIIPVLKLGGTASYTFDGREVKDNWDVLDPEGFPYDASARLAWSGLATLQLRDVLLTVPNVFVSYGKVAGLTQYGAGVELQGEGFCVFVEALSQQSDRMSGGVFDTELGHIHVTPGVTLGDATSAFLKAGYTFSFGNDVSGRKQPDEITLGFGFATPFGRRTPREYGTIAGTVVDAASGAPLAARIEFPGSSLEPVTASAAAGAFRVKRVEAGVYTLTANADKYVRSTVTLQVVDGRLTTAKFKLAPTATAVDVTGKVTDKKTGGALAATVTIPEADSAVFNTDPATGVYKVQLMPGAYSMVVESKDHLKQAAALLVETGKPAVRDFTLIREGAALTPSGIYFDINEVTIKPDSRPALDDAARILKENPTIKAEIQGHADSEGSDVYNVFLSEARAWAVVNYLVQHYGIDMSRLTARGYGESRPVAKNDTEAGRALNRVVFVILDQAGQK